MVKKKSIKKLGGTKTLSPKVQKLRGIIETNESVEYKQILTEELSKKYGV